MPISTRVEQYLNAENDDSDADGASWEALMAELEAAIAAEPGAPSLHALSARMHAAAYEPYLAMCDWEQVLALASDDRDAQLELASVRLRRPDRLAESAVRHEKFAAQGAIEVQRTNEEDEEDDWNDADEERAAMLAEHYAADGTQAMQRLMRQHSADLAFVQRMFDTFDELYGVDPWIHYTLLLAALASHPADSTLRAREARFLVALTNHCAVDSDTIPAGYWESVSGARVHVVTLDRAVRCIDAVCASAPDASLLVAKADLLAAIEHYPAATEAYLQAAALLERDGDGEAAADARTQADLCRQGRQAINRANFAAMEQGMQKLADMRKAMGLEGEADDHGLGDSMAQLRDSLEAAEPAMTREQRAELEHFAASVAKQIAGMTSSEPIALNPIAVADLQGGVIPWFDSLRPALENSGLRLGQQFDNPATNRMLGAQCQGQWWTDDSGASALVLEAVKSLTLRKLVSELDDGSFIMTVDDRGRSFWQYGPRIDVLSVDGDTPIGTMIDLHQARVARAGALALPIDSLARLAEVENKARIAKLAFRASEKVTEIEVRGMHVQFHDEFKAMLQARLG